MEWTVEMVRWIYGCDSEITSRTDTKYVELVIFVDPYLSSSCRRGSASCCFCLRWRMQKCKPYYFHLSRGNNTKYPSMIQKPACSLSLMARFTSPANHADVMSWWVSGGSILECISRSPHPFYQYTCLFWREQRLFLPFIWLFCLFSYNFAVFLVRLDSFPFILFRYAIDFIS